MASRVGAVLTLVVLVIAMSSVDRAEAAGNGLSEDFYAKTCPQMEQVVYKYVKTLFDSPTKNNTAISMVRWAFHDFFNGADGSFLLNSTQFPGNVSEKSSTAQVGMRNSKYINDIKIAVDYACPKRVVSCADVLAVAGAAAVNVMGGPYIKVKTGRRDSRFSWKASADSLPRSYASVDELLKFFKGIGINTAEAVALMGGHTVGRAHCVSFWDRIYPKFDQTLTPKFAAKLKYRCPPNPTHTRFTYIRNDPKSSFSFDNHYYIILLQRQGVMKVDDNLIWDKRTLPYVKLYAADANAWRKTFTIAYQKMSEIKPLTGTQGEIRQKCSLLNKV